VHDKDFAVDGSEVLTVRLECSFGKHQKIAQSGGGTFSPPR